MSMYKLKDKKTNPKVVRVAGKSYATPQVVASGKEELEDLFYTLYQWMHHDARADDCVCGKRPHITYNTSGLISIRCCEYSAYNYNKAWVIDGWNRVIGNVKRS